MTNLTFNTVPTVYPIEATIRNNHTGLDATIKQHGCTSSCGNGLEVMLWTDREFPWSSKDVTVVTKDTTTTLTSFTLLSAPLLPNGLQDKTFIEDIIAHQEIMHIESYLLVCGCHGVEFIPSDTTTLTEVNKLVEYIRTMVDGAKIFTLQYTD